MVWRRAGVTESQYSQQRGKEIVVMGGERVDDWTVLAHVNSMPAALHGSERPSRDVVTLYGEPTAETIALALAAAVESHRDNEEGHSDTIRHLGIWAERGAVGDAAWRDVDGHLVTRDLLIPIEQLRQTARQLLDECGQLIRRLVAGLNTPHSPGGAPRPITAAPCPNPRGAPPAFAPLPALLQPLRRRPGPARPRDRRGS